MDYPYNFTLDYYCLGDSMKIWKKNNIDFSGNIPPYFP